ncbi:rhomboid family intramembrane serine protease [Bradyrhizobium erythrophlei]|uniref:rhomboid family intramembrane serine protease n=1 Tax=Bradyrhizobium erythrophlei TaxID=1437360 RepID=UPI0023EA4F55|nr:rhomboid family intramembrane serine protease [Bradyrhizobium erythrophlei]
MPAIWRFYLACGLAASVAHVMFNPTSIVPALGASGAIAGILGCYMRLFPMARVVVVVPILFNPLFFEVNAFVFRPLVLIQVLQSMMALLLPSVSGDVARWAHVGGFIAGFALGPFLVRSGRRYRAYYPDEGVFGFDTKGRI